MDYFLCKAWLREGALPNLSRLASRGSFGRLETVNPAVSPVAWSSFLTGCNPGKHGIYDFIKVDPRTLAPGSTTLRRIKRDGVLCWQNQRSLPSFADLANTADVGVTQVFAPVSFPAASTAGSLICGMETPDLFGGQGTSHVLTTDPELTAAGQRVARLRESGDRLIADLPIPGGSTLRIALAGAGHKPAIESADGLVPLCPGEWTQWFALRAPEDLVVAQAHCGSVSPLTIYLSPLMYRPDHPLVTSDPDLSRMITHEFGLYPTLGYPYDTGALESGALSDHEFIAHLRQTAGRLHDVARVAAERRDVEVFVAYFTEVDAVQHMFWRELDHGHPLSEQSSEVRGVIKETYQIVDRVVGDFVSGLGEDTQVFVISDHGCHGFRQKFDVNCWLAENGYLTWDDGPGPNVSYWGVDWSKTRAYSYGMGRIALNLVGRERHGQVAPGPQADALLSEISARLLAVRNTQGQGPVVGRVWRMADLYRGSEVGEAPDLTIGFQPGLRSDSTSALGGRATTTMQRNLGKWSGDHASVDPLLVPGVIFSSTALPEGQPGLADMAPTILGTIGVAAPAHMDGQCLIACTPGSRLTPHARPRSSPA
jgi:predicted AlkP superfamily phosphohydrolase/phosphomutase